MTAPKVTKGPKGKIKIEEKVKPEEPKGTKHETKNEQKPEPKVETSPFMSAKERMTHVKPGETVLVT